MSACCRLCESMDRLEVRDSIPTTDEILRRYAPNLKDPSVTGREFRHAVATFNAWLDREIAHAVAAEREAIAGWIDGEAYACRNLAAVGDVICQIDAPLLTGLAIDIRNGAHNEKPATSGP